MGLRSLPSLRLRAVGLASALTTFTLLSVPVSSENCASKALVALQTQAGAAFSQQAPALSIAIKESEYPAASWVLVDRELVDHNDTPPLFHVGSITKTFTAALVLLLDQEHKLSIDAAISEWIALPKAKGITVEMLLTHTSGIPDILDLPGHAAQDSPEDSLAHISKADLLFSPGSRWRYSNSNYLLLGLIIERVTGRKYADVLSERILLPLNLSNTYLWGASNRQGVLPGFRLDCGGTDQPHCAAGGTYPINRVTNGRDWRVAWSAGGMVSSASDLAHWIQALVQGAVLDDAHRKLLLTPTPLSIEGLTDVGQFKGVHWRAMGMGLMQFIFDDGSEAWGHSGYIDGFSAIAAAGDDLTPLAITTALEQSNVYELAASGYAHLDCWRTAGAE